MVLPLVAETEDCEDSTRRRIPLKWTEKKTEICPVYSKLTLSGPEIYFRL